MPMTLRKALFVSMNDLAEAQTAAYGGNWQSSVAKLAQICHTQSIELGLSVVAYDRRAPIGIALFGRRAARGWLHDLAVAPAYRHAGMGTRMMQAVLDEMRQAGTREVELDVAAMRGDAIALYNRLGFQKTRSYLNLEMMGDDLGLDRMGRDGGREVVAGTEAQLIEAYALAQRTEPVPCWDRSLASLLAYPDGYISRLVEGDAEIGLMHYLARPAEGRDPDRLRPLFVRLAPGVGAAELAQLFALTDRAAFSELRGLAVRIALEPADSAVAGLLRELGMPVAAESYDMRLAL